MPVGGYFIADLVFRDCDVIIEDQNLQADLIPLELKEFDAILGMD